MQLLGRHAFWPILAAPLSLLFLAPSSWAGEYEPVVVHDEANEPNFMEYGYHTSGGSISSTTDLDSYIFFGERGDKIDIVTNTSGYYDDPKIELYDPLGGSVGSNYCSGGSGGCSVTLGATLQYDGFYTIWISDAGTNDTFSYTMSLERIPPTCCTPAIAYSSPMGHSISPVTDSDFFAFEGAAGTTIRVALGTSGYYDDPWLRIVDPSGAQILSQYCSGGSGGCSFYVNQPLQLTGTYHLRIADAGQNDTFTYSVSLNCMGGPCPPELPPIGENYGSGYPNSVGPGGVLEAMGSDLVSYNQLDLRATGLPPHAYALFFFGPNQVAVGLGSGVRLVGGSLTRLGPAGSADASGTAEQTVDLTPLATAGLIAPGAPSNFQCWYRDTADSPPFNLTDAVHIDWH